MSKPTVFLSYDRRDSALVERIEAVLTPDFRVLRDRIALHPGATWRDELEDWLLECDAALVVCTPRSEESAWVQTEASILGLRCRKSPHPPCLIPLLVDGFDAARLRSGGLAVSGLDALQGLPILSTSSDYSDVARLLHDKLRPKMGSGGLRELHRALAARLNRGGDELVECLCEALDLEVRQFELVGNKGACLADFLVGIELDRLALVVRKLAPVDVALTAFLVNALFPMAWVDSSSARLLAQHARQSSSTAPLAPIALRAREAKTPAAYVHRAAEIPEGWTTVTCNPSWSHEDPQEWIISEIRSELAHARGILGLDYSDEELQEELRIALQEGPVVIVLPPEVADLDKPLLETLNQTFGPFVLFFRSESSLGMLSQKLAALLALPDVDPKLERRAWNWHRRTHEDLTGRRGPV
jgi:hypothetical protein